MSDAPEIRLQGYFDAVRRMLEGSGLFPDVRMQFDSYDLADVMTESFRPPAARVFVLKMEPQQEAAGASSVEIGFTIAAVAGRTGRADVRIASADIEASRLILLTAARIQADPYFGQVRCTAARIDGFRVAVSEKANKQGLAVMLLSFTATLLELIPTWDPVAALMDATRPASPPALVLNGEPMDGVDP